MARMQLVFEIPRYILAQGNSYALYVRLSVVKIVLFKAIVTACRHFNSFSPQPSRVDPEGSTGLKFNIFGSVQL